MDGDGVIWNDGERPTQKDEEQLTSLTGWPCPQPVHAAPDGRGGRAMSWAELSRRPGRDEVHRGT